MESINFEKSDLYRLSLRLKALTVFGELLKDSVIASLCNFLESLKFTNGVSDSIRCYCNFVSKLYEADSADLSGYIKYIVCNTENVYMKTIGCKNKPDKYMEAAVAHELETLEIVAALTPQKLTSLLECDIFLPGFPTGEANIAESFMHRTENISKYGYGAYAKNPMFYIDAEDRIIPVKNPDSIMLEDLVDYESERQVIIDNTKALLAGKPAANILLTGDAGTGKSSTVKAVVNAFFDEGLRIIEVRKEQLSHIPKILDELAVNPLKFILFIDDLSFQKDDDNFNALKAVLEGSVSAKSENVVIYATSNRRHIIKEKFSDREGDDIHRNDTMQEMISLSERFGIHVRFQKPDKNTFLHIVHHLAEQKGVMGDREQIDLLAERFALERGGRSARLARQFVDNLVTKTDL